MRQNVHHVLHLIGILNRPNVWAPARLCSTVSHL